MAEAETVCVMAVPMGPGAAAVAAALVGLELDPKWVALAADFAARETVPRVAETVFALEVGPREAECLSGFVPALETDCFEGSK